MDGFFGKFLTSAISLGIETTLTEVAAGKKHARELKVLDHQLDRQEKIAAARSKPAATAVQPATRQQSKALPAPVSSCQIMEEVESIDMPTTEETIAELKDRLREELYDFERDMQKGMRIAGKPCDCGNLKHMPHIKATSRELMSYEKNPMYGQIVSWMDSHISEFSPKEIYKHEPAFYQAMTPDIRNFRKQLNGDDYGYTQDIVAPESAGNFRKQLEV